MWQENQQNIYSYTSCFMQQTPSSVQVQQFLLILLNYTQYIPAQHAVTCQIVNLSDDEFEVIILKKIAGT